MDYDVVIIGGGTAGFAAMNKALKLGKKVALVEKGPFGGLCILHGCMPSKTLLRTAQIAHDIHEGPTYGVKTSQLEIDPHTYINRKDKIINEFVKYRQKSLDNKDVKVINGEAKFLDAHTIQVGEEKISSENFIVSTGSNEFIPPIKNIDKISHITSEQMLDMTELPRSIIILGGGPIGLEAASYFNPLGTQVILIQRSSHVMSREDKDVAMSLQDALVRQGVTVYTDTEIKSVEQVGSSVQAHFNCNGKDEIVEAQTLMLAVGRTPNILNLDLDKAGVEVENGRPKLNQHLQSTQPNIYFVGDCAGIMPVVNAAIKEGEIAIENAFSDTPQMVDYSTFPIAVFSTPEFAQVGYRESQLQKGNVPYEVATYPFNDQGKAICIGKTYGMLKIIYGKEDKKILGVSIVGDHASELIHEASVLYHFNATLNDLAQIPHIHPTLAEIFTYLTDELDL